MLPVGTKVVLKLPKDIDNEYHDWYVDLLKNKEEAEVMGSNSECYEIRFLSSNTSSPYRRLYVERRMVEPMEILKKF